VGKNCIDYSSVFWLIQINNRKQETITCHQAHLISQAIFPLFSPLQSPNDESSISPSCPSSELDNDTKGLWPARQTETTPQQTGEPIARRIDRACQIQMGRKKTRLPSTPRTNDVSKRSLEQLQ
jgi:hypothetical protein